MTNPERSWPNLEVVAPGTLLVVNLCESPVVGKRPFSLTVNQGAITDLARVYSLPRRFRDTTALIYRGEQGVPSTKYMLDKNRVPLEISVDDIWNAYDKSFPLPAEEYVKNELIEKTSFFFLEKSVAELEAKGMGRWPSFARHGVGTIAGLAAVENSGLSSTGRLIAYGAVLGIGTLANTRASMTERRYTDEWARHVIATGMPRLPEDSDIHTLPDLRQRWDKAFAVKMT